MLMLVETVEVTIVKHGRVTASDLRLHHVLIILTLTFIQGQTDLNHKNNRCLICFINYSSNAYHVCCEDSPTKGICEHRQSGDLDLP